MARRAPPRILLHALFDLYRGLQRTFDLLAPPQLSLIDRAFGMARSATLGLAAELRIADHLSSGAKSAEELAALTKTKPDPLFRMMKTLVSFGVFEMRDGERFANNRLSDGLRSDNENSMRDFVAYFGSPSNLRAYTDLRGTLESGQDAFSRVHGMNVWEWFNQHRDEGKTFAGAMTNGTTMDAPAMAVGYDYGKFTRICDVAGGRGQLLAEILERNPKLQGVLFDEKYVLDEADAVLRDRGVANRVERVAGSFFASDPVAIPSGCDAYILKDILHDWGDSECRTILSNVRRAAPTGAKLISVETVVERSDCDHPKPVMDLHMMMVCVGGKQRSRLEFETLYRSAGFRLLEVRPLAAMHSLVVGEAV